MDDDDINTALRGFVAEAMDLDADRQSVNDRFGDLHGRVRDAGINVTIFREICREMKQDPEARRARYQLLDEYRNAIGALDGTPLGDAAKPSVVVEMPRPFAEQPVHDPKRPRGRPRKDRTAEALANARAHLNFENIAAGDV